MSGHEDIKIRFPILKLESELITECNDSQTIYSNETLEICCYEGGMPDDYFYILLEIDEDNKKTYRIERKLLLSGLLFLDSDAERVLGKEKKRDEVIRLKNSLEDEIDLD
jgi:hypothetical protein